MITAKTVTGTLDAKTINTGSLDANTINTGSLDANTINTRLLDAKTINAASLITRSIGAPPISPAIIFEPGVADSVSLNHGRLFAEFGSCSLRFVLKNGIAPTFGSPPFGRLFIGNVDFSSRPIAQNSQVINSEDNNTFWIAALISYPNGTVYLQDLTGQGVPSFTTISSSRVYELLQSE